MAENKPGKEIKPEQQSKIVSEAESLASGKGAENKPVTTDTTDTPAVSTDPAVVNQPANVSTNQPAQQPAPISAEQAESKAKEQILKEYGPGYVEAEKKGQKTIFSARAWDLLGDNKEGWTPVVKTPKEVQDLQAKKTAEK